MLYSIPNYSIFPIQYYSYQFHLFAIFFSILAMQLHIHDFYSPVSFMQIPFWYRCGVEKLRYVQIVRLCHQNWVRIMRSFLFLISYENWKLYAINCMSYRLSVGFQCGVSQTLMFFIRLLIFFSAAFSIIVVRNYMVCFPSSVLFVEYWTFIFSESAKDNF